MENQLVKRKVIGVGAVIATCAFSMMLNPQMAKADTAAKGGTVRTVKELNEALGGKNKVEGNKVILKDNIILSNEIVFDNAKDTITIDMNSKKISFDSKVKDNSMFSVINSKLNIKGNGKFDVTKGKKKEQNSVIAIVEKSKLTINNGEFKTGGGASIYVGPTTNVKPSDLIINGGDIKGNAIYAGSTECGALNLKVNGGKIGNIHLDFPTYMTDVTDPEAVVCTNHNIEINKGTIEGLYCERTNCKMSGGTIGKGGFEAKLDSDVTVKGGTIKGITYVAGKNLKVLGGKLSQTNVEAKFTMRGGSIKSSDCALKIIYTHDVVNNISGGNITTTKKNAKGVVLMGDSILKISGGKISNLSGKGKAGIYNEGNKSNNKVSKVYFQGMEDKSASVTGYSNAVYTVPDYGTLYIKDNTKVTAKSQQKDPFYAGQEIPQTIKGDMVVEYAATK